MLARRGALGRRKGAMLIVWAVCGLPMMFFSCALTIDMSRLYVAHREAVNAAQAAAQAGAYQISPGSVGAGDGYAATLEEQRAQQAATSAWDKAVAEQAVPLLGPRSEVTVSSGAQEVTVHVTYTVPGLIFTGLFGQTTDPTDHISASAFICVPGASGQATGGYCQLPTSY